MTYRPTILNTTAGALLIGVFVYTVWNYSTLSAGEGWGIVAMFGFAGVSLLAGLADLILQQSIKNKKTLAVIELVVLIGLTIAILNG